MARHPDLELAYSRNYLIARSLEQHRNNIMVSGPTEVLASAVGEMIPTSLAKDPGVREVLEEGWREWAQKAGSDGVSTWGEICEQVVGSACQTGDVGIQYDHNTQLGGITPLRINVVDGYRIATPMGFAGDATVRFGVETKRGAEDAYWVARENASTLSREGFYRFDRVRNGRPNFSLFRRPEAVRRAGQTRSTPICAACLLELKEVGDYDRATVRGAVKRSRVTTIIKGGDPAAIAKYFQTMKTKRATDPDEATALEEGTKVRLVRTPDGATLILPNYMDYEATPNDSTDSGYESFIMTRLKKIANAWMLPFEVAYQIWADANFARARLHYLRESKTANRWRTRMASGFANNTWGLHAQYMAAADKAIKLTPDILRAEWRGSSAEYMDLAGEIAAEAEARQTMVMSPQTMARRTGRDADREMRLSLEFVAKVKKEMEDRGLTNADFEIAFGPVNNRNAAAQSAGKGTP
jgi:capsid protein